MRKQYLQTFLFVGCFSLATLTARAQQVVHALTGTVTAINATTKTIQIKTDDGSEGLFTVVLKPGVTFDFEKSIRAGATPAASFNKIDSRVLVYYIGDSDVRTAVALEDLGAGPFIKSTGTVIKINRHDHLLTIKNSTGQQESFHIDNRTVAEATEGVEEGQKFDPQKGEHVRVTATSANGGETALFIRSL